MLGLILLASHLVGDFVFQTRWQAARKLTDHAYRARHVCGYTAAFVPVVAWRASAGGGPHFLAAPWIMFLGLLWLLHYATDSRRFRSTLGDALEWNRRWWNGGVPLSPPANPWEPLPILIDQALHVAQLAALGFLLA